MSDDELLKQLDEPVGDGHSYRAVVINGQQYNPLHVAAAARIRKQRDLLDECERAFAEFAKAGGAGYAFRSREILAKLRAAQEKDR